MLRLDYLSCVLTIVSTILVGRRCWEGWILAGVNSVVICLIGFRTSQLMQLDDLHQELVRASGIEPLTPTMSR